MKNKKEKEKEKINKAKRKIGKKNDIINILLPLNGWIYLL